MNDQVGVVGGLQGEAAVADCAAVTPLLMQVHYVLQVVTALSKGHLNATYQERERERETAGG